MMGGVVMLAALLMTCVELGRIGCADVLNGLHEATSIIDERRCDVFSNHGELLLDVRLGGLSFRVCVGLSIHNTPGDRENARRARLFAECAFVVFDVGDAFLNPPPVMMPHTT